MELLKVPKLNISNRIPVIGIESHSSLSNESHEDTYSRIAKCAYYKAEARGFGPGHEMEDWLEAETEVT